MKPVTYGNRLVSDMAERRIQALKQLPLSEGVTISKQDRRVLEHLHVLRREVKLIEDRFAARSLAVPSDLTEPPRALDRTYTWKRQQENAQQRTLQPLYRQVRKLQQQASIDLLKADDRKAQGAVLDAYAKALEAVK